MSFDFFDWTGIRRPRRQSSIGACLGIVGHATRAESSRFRLFSQAARYFNHLEGERAVEPASDQRASVWLSFTKIPLSSRTGVAQVGLSATR